MGEYHRRRIKVQSAFQHFAGMDFGVTESAGEERFVSKQLVLVIEVQHDKLFTLEASHLQPEPVACGLCGGEGYARFTQVLVKQTQGSLNCSL